MSIRRPLPLVLFLAGCAPAGAPPNPPVGVHLGGPATPDEKRIADHLRNDWPYSESQWEWVEFGPDDDAGLTHLHDPAQYRIVRVAAYATPKNAPRAYFEKLFVIDGERDLILPDQNRPGRDWIASGAKEKQRREEEAARRP